MLEDSITPPGPPEKDDAYLGSWRLSAVIGSLCLGIFLFGLDINIIGVAIPRITTEFSSLADVAWYGSAYMLTLTAFQPLFGNLYKYFNAKVVYLVSLAIFEGEGFSIKVAISYWLQKLILLQWDPPFVLLRQDLPLSFLDVPCSDLAPPGSFKEHSPSLASLLLLTECPFSKAL